jgi:hypothetical protein
MSLKSTSEGDINTISCKTVLIDWIVIWKIVIPGSVKNYQLYKLHPLTDVLAKYPYYLYFLKLSKNIEKDINY